MGCVNSHSIQETKKFKFVIVGLENSGKTAIFEYLRQGRFVETKPTTGVNVDYPRKDIMLFDVPGKMPQLWMNYYDNLDGLIFVVDSTNKEQLYQVKDELLRLNKDLEYTNVIVMVMFTKQDLNPLDNRTLIEESGVYRQLDQDVIVQMCSSKTGDGILEGLSKLQSLVQKQIKLTLNTITNRHIRIAV